MRKVDYTTSWSAITICPVWRLQKRLRSALGENGGGGICGGHEKATYTAMLLSGELNAHLEEADRSASEMFDRLVAQIAEQEGITEQLKAANQMEWVQQTNNIRNRTSEIVHTTLISE